MFVQCPTKTSSAAKKRIPVNAGNSGALVIPPTSNLPFQSADRNFAQRFHASFHTRVPLPSVATFEDVSNQIHAAVRKSGHHLRLFQIDALIICGSVSQLCERRIQG